MQEQEKFYLFHFYTFRAHQGEWNTEAGYWVRESFWLVATDQETANRSAIYHAKHDLLTISQVLVTDPLLDGGFFPENDDATQELTAVYCPDTAMYYERFIWDNSTIKQGVGDVAQH